MGGSATSPQHSRGSENKGTKSKVANSPLPSRGPTSGRKCYATPAFLGVPKQGDKIRSGCLTPAFSGGHKWVEVLHHPCNLGRPHTRGQNQKWQPHPCLLTGPQVGGSATSPLHSRGSPNKGTKPEMAASPLLSWGPTKGWKCYVIPCILGGPQTRGQNQNTPAFLGTHKRVEVLHNPCILGGPQTRGQNQKWLPHPCLLGGPQKGGSAT